jgi:hypothetical protein
VARINTSFYKVFDYRTLAINLISSVWVTQLSDNISEMFSMLTSMYHADRLELIADSPSPCVISDPLMRF